MAIKFTRSWQACGLAIALLLLGGCAGDPDQAALEATIADAQSAAERGEMGAVIELLADDFVGQSGRYDRQQLRGLLLAIRMRHSNVGVSRVSTDYDVRPGFASVEMKLLLTGGSGGLLPESGRLMDLRTQWRVVDGGWQLTAAEWDGVGRL